MMIGGFSKYTLLDYPQKIAAEIFTNGCNFRCPFCHNSDLVLNSYSDEFSIDEIDEYLSKRSNILDGVVITGGEPTLWSGNGLEELINMIKSHNLLVKLDTNGTSTIIQDYIKDNMVDYIAMDIKTGRKNYAKVSGTDNLHMDSIQSNIDFLKKSSIDYEFRTTVVDGLHTEEDFYDIAKWLYASKKYFLQLYKDSGNILQSNNSFKTPSENKMFKYKDIVSKTINHVEIRGIITEGRKE